MTGIPTSNLLATFVFWNLKIIDDIHEDKVGLVVDPMLHFVV